MKKRAGYLALGYDSLFTYCVSYLNLTGDQSYAFMAIAKKCETIPELKTAVEQNEMTFSNARKLVSVMTPENKTVWIEKGKILSQKAIEREIAKVSPRMVIESIRPVAGDEAELKVGLDKEMEENLQRSKALLKTGSAKPKSQGLLLRPK